MVIQPLLMIRLAAIATGVMVLWMMQRDHKKEKSEAFLSLLTTWVLAFIGAKVVTRWDLLLEYPISVLSYPSGTSELYIAMVVTIVVEWRKRYEHSRYSESSLLVFATSFLGFALLQQLLLNQGDLVDMIFAFIFFILVLFIGRVSLSIAIISTVGAMLAVISQSPGLMGYRIDGWFYVMISFIVWSYIVLRRRIGERFT
ncbi:hypothetical protein J0K78_11140 [Halobacillus sp. GSS1]|uniref:hypothetical protein n=1 Tax=Halobacillus sp. GSS1 TaxID=2815919 RepID=UPI001A8ED10F|nr:hypothetical protein [Halobacillus sp. GSS1]MBN9654821.1 hypothetical protein [Halobacillus sp. GSS1]